MKKIRVLIFVSLLTFVTCSSSCNSKVQSVEKAEEAGSTTIPSITISYVSYMTEISSAIRVFKNTYKDINLVEEEFKIDQRDEYRQKLTTALSAGAGPDIIIASNNVFESIYKILSSGALYDLNKFISKDDNFNMDSFNKTVFDSGTYEEGRYLIPLEYQIPAFFTTQEVLDRNGISINDADWTWDDMANIVKQFMQSKGDDKKYFFDSEFDIISLITGSGIPFIDYVNRKTSFNSAEFVKLINIYKEIYPSICPQDVSDKNNNCYICMLQNDSIIMCNVMCGLSGLYVHDSITSGVLKNKTQVFTFPTYKKGEKIPARTNYLVGINSNSKNKEAAYKFIKVLLSKDLQCADKNGNRLNIPVNLEAYAIERDYFVNSINLVASNYTTYADHTVKGMRLSEEFALKMDKMVERIGTSMIPDNTVNNMIKTEVSAFLNGDVTAEQAADKINSRVDLYLNE